MTQKQQPPTENDIRQTSRDLLKVYNYVLNNEDQKMFSSQSIGRAIGATGKSLGGILAGTQKVGHMPIIVRQGTIKAFWAADPKKQTRLQLWCINQQLPSDIRKSIRKILSSMMLEDVAFPCPRCEQKGRRSWTMAKKRGGFLCPNCGSTYQSQKSAWPKKTSHYST